MFSTKRLFSFLFGNRKQTKILHNQSHFDLSIPHISRKQPPVFNFISNYVTTNIIKLYFFESYAVGNSLFIWGEKKISISKITVQGLRELCKCHWLYAMLMDVYLHWIKSLNIHLCYKRNNYNFSQNKLDFNTIKNIASSDINKKEQSIDESNSMDESPRILWKPMEATPSMVSLIHYSAKAKYRNTKQVGGCWGGTVKKPVVLCEVVGMVLHFGGGGAYKAIGCVQTNRTRR